MKLQHWIKKRSADVALLEVRDLSLGEKGNARSLALPLGLERLLHKKGLFIRPILTGRDWPY